VGLSTVAGIFSRPLPLQDFFSGSSSLHYQPRSQGFSHLQGKSPGNEVATLYLFLYGSREERGGGR